MRTTVLLAIAIVMLVVWIFPVAWGLLTSFKTERDVLAYPPEVIFEPTLVNYHDVFFGGASIVPNLVSSLIVSGLTTIAGFGSLIIAKHQGIKSLGYIMATGVTTCMIVGLTFLPALLNFLNERGWTIKKKNGNEP